MTYVGKQSDGVSKVAVGEVTDHTATEIRKAITSVSRQDGLTVVIFGICVLAVIIVGKATDEWTFSSLFAFACLIFYGLYSKNKVDMAKLEISRQQLRIQEGLQQRRQAGAVPDDMPSDGGR